MPLRDLFLFGTLAVLVPAMLVHPYIGALAWVVFGLLNPHLLAFGAAYDFPFSLVIGVCTMAGIVLTRDHRRIKGGVTALVLVVLMVWMSITTLVALNPESALPMWSRVMKVFIMTLVLMFLLHTKRQVDLLVAAIALSIGFYGVKGGIFTIVTGGTSMVLGPGESVIGGNNALGVANVMLIPLLAHFYQQSDKRWVRWTLLLCIVLCVAAVLGSYSRGAVLALGVMGAMLWLRSSHKTVTLALLLLTALVLVPFMPERWDSRMRTIETYEQDGSAMGRINAWTTAWNISTDRVAGAGFEYPNSDVIAKYSPSGEVLVAHSIFFQVLGEHGFIGLALFLLFWILVWNQCSSIRRQVRGQPEMKWAYSLASMIQASLVGYAVGGAFLNLAFWDMPYYLYAAVIVTRYVVRDQSRPANVVQSIGARSRSRAAIGATGLPVHPL